MSRKPQHHVPEIFCTVNDRLEKTMKAAEVTYEVKPPQQKKDGACSPSHHPLYPPSGMERVKLCPASVRMSSNLPELPASDDADEGRMLHSAVKAGDVVLDSEQAELVKYCRNLIAELSEGDKGHVFHEEGITVFSSDYKELTFGTCDVLILFDDKVKIIEEKYGRNEVEEAANNLQMACYAVGAAQKYGVSQVECHVFQSRIHHHSSYTFTDIPAVLASLEVVIEASRKQEWVFNPSEEACRYCRAKFTCKPCLAALSSLPVVATGPEASQQDLAVMMPSLIPAAKQASKLADAILSKAKELIGAGTPISGWYLKDGNEVRRVGDIVKAFELGKDLISQEKFLPLCSVSVGDLEELFIQEFKKVNTFSEMSLKECKAEFSKRFESCIYKSRNKPSLAEVKK